MRNSSHESLASGDSSGTRSCPMSKGCAHRHPPVLTLLCSPLTLCAASGPLTSADGTNSLLPVPNPKDTSKFFTITSKRQRLDEHHFPSPSLSIPNRRPNPRPPLLPRQNHPAPIPPTQHAPKLTKTIRLHREPHLPPSPTNVSLHKHPSSPILHHL